MLNWHLVLVYILMLLYMYIAPGQGQTIPWGQMLMSTESLYHFAHLLQVLKQSLWSLILNDFIHVYSTRGGTDNPLGTKFWCQQKFLITLLICCQFKKKSLWILIFNSFLLFFFHMYNSPRQGQTTHWGQKFYDNRKAFSLCPHVASFKMISSKSDFIHIFNDFIHVYSPGARVEKPLRVKLLMSTESPYHFDHLLQVSNKSLWILILYTFFNVFPHVFSPGADTDNPLWTKFWCQQKGPVTLLICCKFQKNIFEVWFYTYFCLFFISVHSPGAAADNPLGSEFLF